MRRNVHQNVHQLILSDGVGLHRIVSDFLEKHQQIQGFSADSDPRLQIVQEEWR